MLIVAIAGFLSWALLRRFGWKWSLASFLVVTSVVSLLVINDVQTGGVVRDDIGPETDLTYSIVYTRSIALFPFMIQKHHNWTSQTFIYYVTFLTRDGNIVSQTSPTPDQSEFMHLALFAISISICFQGFVVALLVTLGAEFITWWRKPDRIEILRNTSTKNDDTE
ncbi:MAG: hypothetical protein ACFFEF_19070 [Candidatus Thorarchaeota archaeon]